MASAGQLLSECMRRLRPKTARAWCGNGPHADAGMRALEESTINSPIGFAKAFLSFHNRAGGTMERWLPDTPFQGGSRSEEEDPRTMDSWYLLHILLNVGRVAAMGYEDAAKVFLASVDYAVKGAHRFRYRWPVFYDTRTFKVLKAEIAPGKGGERDIPGLYTHVMLQA